MVDRDDGICRTSNIQICSEFHGVVSVKFMGQVSCAYLNSLKLLSLEFSIEKRCIYKFRNLYSFMLYFRNVRETGPWVY